MATAQKLKKILIIEDDLALKPLWRFILKKIFSVYTMDWSVSCEEALKLVKKSLRQGSPYDLIVVDVFLAGSSTGIDFLKLKEVQGLHCETILVSHASQEDMETLCKKLAIKTKTMTKPLSIMECTEIVRTTVQNGDAA
jgi:response regulator of citrate/malate metabolism